MAKSIGLKNVKLVVNNIKTKKANGTYTNVTTANGFFPEMECGVAGPFTVAGNRGAVQTTINFSHTFSAVPTVFCTAVTPSGATGAVYGSVGTWGGATVSTTYIVVCNYSGTQQTFYVNWMAVVTDKQIGNGY